jgi:hypothetical protein
MPPIVQHPKVTSDAALVSRTLTLVRSGWSWLALSRQLLRGDLKV